MTDTDQLPVPSSDAPVPVLASAAPAASAAHAHPNPRQYVMIAVVLVIITALEVAISYIPEGDIPSGWIIALLGVMALTKFVLVVAWYMHLKTDSKALRRFFIVGLVGAVILFTVIALVMHAFSNSYNFSG